MRTKVEIQEEYLKVCAKIGKLSVKLIVIQNMMDPLVKEAIQLEKEFMEVQNIVEQVKK